MDANVGRRCHPRGHFDPPDGRSLRGKRLPADQPVTSKLRLVHHENRNNKKLQPKCLNLLGNTNKCNGATYISCSQLAVSLA